MKKSKVFMLVSIITLVVAIIGSAGTYAWYVWNTTEEEETKIVTNVGAATIYFDGGASITDAKLRPVSDKANGIVKDIQIKTDTSSGLKFNLYLDITSLDTNLQHESFKYALYKGSSTTPIKEGNFTSTYLDSNTSDCPVNTGVKHIELLTNESVTTTLTTYTLYIWIDGVNYDNPTTMTNKPFSFNLHASGEDAIIQEGLIPDITETIDGSLAHQLVSKYIAADKTNANNNGVIYYLDATNHLMSDIVGNLRFYGPSASVNNYIYFNCNDYTNQGLTDSEGKKNCELWRIIGVFDGKVKIIKNDSIGSLAWDQDKNQNSNLTTYSNNWETSSLQLFLNGLYYNREETESHTYLSGSTGTTTTTLDLTTIGITEATRTNNLISESIWYLGGYANADVYPNEIYTYERTNTVGTTIISGNPFTISANIGLMYVSDYGYGTDLSKCNSQLSAYNSGTDSYACRTNNWLFNNANQWLITPVSSESTYVWYANAVDLVGNYDVYDTNYGVRPVLYLNSELGIESGHAGTSADPYRISVS